LKKQVKYFNLLFILGIRITYIDTEKVGENRLFNENGITDLVEHYAKIIADNYNLIIYLPEYVLSFLGKIQHQNNWKMIKGNKKEGEEQQGVVILKGKNGKYNLLDDKLIILKFNDSVFWENTLKLPNNTVNSFFNAILLFLNNYLVDEIKYSDILKLMEGLRNTEKFGDRLHDFTDEDIETYAQKIANEYNLVICLSFLGVIDGFITYIKKSKIIQGDNTEELIEFEIEISKLEGSLVQDTTYNLVTTKIIDSSIKE
jgi:hypothetical protein